MPGPDDSPAGDLSSPRQRLPAWLAGLAGMGLFLAGGVLGAILVMSITLYRAPVQEATPALPTSEGAVPATVPSPTMPAAPSRASPSPRPTRPPVGPVVGHEAPSFALAGLDGREYSLIAFRGRTVLVHFWASWCPPCRIEWPDLRAFAEGVGPGVVLLAVNVEEPAEVVLDFLGDEAMPFPVLLDGEGSVNERYRVAALPTTFLVDSGGIIRQVVPGSLDLAALERLVGGKSSQP